MAKDEALLGKNAGDFMGKLGGLSINAVIRIGGVVKRVLYMIMKLQLNTPFSWIIDKELVDGLDIV